MSTRSILVEEIVPVTVDPTDEQPAAIAADSTDEPIVPVTVDPTDEQPAAIAAIVAATAKTVPVATRKSLALAAWSAANETDSTTTDDELVALFGVIPNPIDYLNGLAGTTNLAITSIPAFYNDPALLARLETATVLHGRIAARLSAMVPTKTVKTVTVDPLATRRSLVARSGLLAVCRTAVHAALASIDQQMLAVDGSFADAPLTDDETAVVTATTLPDAIAKKLAAIEKALTATATKKAAATGTSTVTRSGSTLAESSIPVGTVLTHLVHTATKTSMTPTAYAVSVAGAPVVTVASRNQALLLCNGGKAQSANVYWKGYPSPVATVAAPVDAVADADAVTGTDESVLPADADTVDPSTDGS